jgi:hypothetical protein
MTTETSTINKLVELFLMSRSKGERVSLSMESKDGKDSLTFSINNPSGSPAGQTGNWTPPAPGSPWTWPPPPRPWPPLIRRKKTPSQDRRDQKRKQDFLEKKDTAPLEDPKKDDTKDDILSYEMQFDAPNCSDEEIQKCFDFNLKDELKGENVEKEDTEYSFEKKDEKLILKKDGENYKALKIFIVKIKNKEQVKKAMEVFVDTVNFDPAVFKGTIRTAKQANLREFKIL